MLAQMFRFSIIANGRPGEVIDVLGQPVNMTRQGYNNSGGVLRCDDTCGTVATIDFDATFIHEDGNCKKVGKMLSEHSRSLSLETLGCGMRHGTPQDTFAAS